MELFGAAGVTATQDLIDSPDFFPASARPSWGRFLFFGWTGTVPRADEAAGCGGLICVPLRELLRARYIRQRACASVEAD